MPLTRVNGDFTQVSNIVVVTAPSELPIGVALTDHLIDSTSNAVIFSGFRMGADGSLNLITNLDDTTSQSQSIVGEWRLLPGDYEVRVTVSSGDDPFSFSSDNDALSTWLELDVDRLWWFHVNVSGAVELSGIWHVELRRIGAAVTQAECDMTVLAHAPASFGTAIEYVGSDLVTGASFPANAAYNFGTNSFTVEAWCRVSADASDFLKNLVRVSSGSGGTLRQWRLSYQTNFTTNITSLRMDLKNGATNVISTISLTIPFGTWFHYAVAVDRVTNVLRIYLDGTEVAVRSIAAFAGLSASSGTQAGLLIDECVAAIDDVRIWNVLRSQADISANMSAPLSNPSGEANLVAYWKFDEGSGTNLSDSSLTGNNATIDQAFFTPGPP